MRPNAAAWVACTAAASAFLSGGGCGAGGSSAPAYQDAGNGLDASSEGAAPPLACPPASLGAWQPTEYHHAAPAQPSACTAALIDDFYASCLAPEAPSGACNQSWGTGQDAAHATCQSCLVTPASAATWGALITFGSTVSLDVAGCIELLDAGAVPCATQVQAADECEHQACDAACPVTDDASFTQWKACVSAAAAPSSGVCASYVLAAGCANAEIDGGVAARCVTGTDFEAGFKTLAAVFCSPG